MTLSSFVQRGAVLTVMLVEMMTAIPTFAQAQNQVADRFSGVAVNVTGAGDPVRIDILKWSTEADRNQVTAALAKGAKELETALQPLTTQGYVWTSESAGYIVKFAQKISMPDGTERIILATDRRLGSWDPKLWKPVGSAAATDYSFTVIEMRLDPKKPGEGKTSIAAKVIPDTEGKGITLENYAGVPVSIKDLKRVSEPKT